MSVRVYENLLIISSIALTYNKETLKKAENQEIAGECQQHLDYELYWLGVNLRQHLTDDVEHNLKALELTRLIMDSVI